MFFNQKESLEKTSLSDRSYKPAITYGGALKLWSNSPDVLAEILQQAAHTSGEIVYILPDKSDKFQFYKDLQQIAAL